MTMKIAKKEETTDEIRRYCGTPKIFSRRRRQIGERIKRSIKSLYRIAF